MPAYLISQIEVHDPQGYDEYRKLVGPSLAKYGGKFVVRGGRIEVLEGNWAPKRIVVCEFASADRARVVSLPGVQTGHGHSPENRQRTDHRRRRALNPI
jgi:uncharacterized protein (DUF1330 family)